MDSRPSLGQVKSLLESSSVINESDDKKKDKFNKKKLSVRMLDVNLLLGNKFQPRNDL